MDLRKGTWTMSDNSFINIKRTKKGYVVTHADADDNTAYETHRLKTVAEALAMAQSMQETLSPEYGITLDLYRLEEI